jgi:NADH:ubiquinone oxidoreductase subunit C
MTFEEILVQAETLLAPFAVGATRHEDHRVDVVVKRESLCAAVKALTDARWGYLITITGLDLPWPKPKASAVPVVPARLPDDPMDDKLEALYHFTEGPVVVTLRVTVPYTDPHIPSICAIVPTATLYERELQEMFGFVIDDTPVKDRLVLPDDWPDGVYPLRKSFTTLQNATANAAQTTTAGPRG